MKLVRLLDVRHESGHCYVGDPEWSGLPGESVDSARRSSLILFEDGRQLGPASAAHDRVRNEGGGAFSHWGSQVYFSTTDNSNPRTNGRTYLCLVCENADEEASRAQPTELTPRSLAAALSASISAQGAELHAAYSLRTLLMYCRRAGIDLSGLTCLEIGSSPSCGLAIALAMLGARNVILNNVVRIASESIDAHFARNIALLTNLVTATQRTLDQVVVFADDGTTCRLNPEIFTVLGEVDAIDLPGRIPQVDFIFSFSVLEHIRRLPEVMAGLRSRASPACRAIHAVDARDHTDFSDPLKYLRLDAEAFRRQYSDEHNRWRYSDYRNIFTESGWRVVSSAFMGALPVLEAGTTDMYAVACEGPEARVCDDPAKLERAISRDGIQALAPEYRGYSDDDLSILVFIATLAPR